MNKERVNQISWDLANFFIIPIQLILKLFILLGIALFNLIKYAVHYFSAENTAKKKPKNKWGSSNGKTILLDKKKVGSNPAPYNKRRSKK